MKTACVLSILMTLAGTGALLANEVTFTGGGGYGPYQTGEGGELPLQPDQQLSWVLGYYSPLASDIGGLPGTFQTLSSRKPNTSGPGPPTTP